MGMYGEIGAQGMSQTGADWSMGLSLIGRAMAQGDYDKANALYQSILDSISMEQVPEFKQLVAQEIPNASQILGAGEGRDAQSRALAKLQSFIDQNGLDAQARSANQESLSAADQHAQGNRQALQGSMARKGMDESGTNLASQLQANQSSANQGRNSSLQIAGDARQRAMDALGKYAQTGSQMRGQDIDVESKNAAAEQERNIFNAKMRNAAQQGNNDNLENDFKNRMLLQQQKNNARAMMAGRRLAGAKQTQSDWSSMGQGMNYKHQSAAEGSEEMPF